MSVKEPFVVPTCTACGCTAFPPRALCPHCGAGGWRGTVVRAGLLENATVLRRVAGVAGLREVSLGVVLIGSGVRVLARLRGAPRRGSRIGLRVVDGALVGRPLKITNLGKET